MNPHLRNTLAQILLVAYVLSGVLLEVGHHDVHAIECSPTATVASHDCGANEIHVPLDRRHECLACSQSTLRVATAETCSPASIATFLYLRLVPATDESALHPDIIHTGKRGPPQA